MSELAAFIAFHQGAPAPAASFGFARSDYQGWRNALMLAGGVPRQDRQKLDIAMQLLVRDVARGHGSDPGRYQSPLAAAFTLVGEYAVWRAERSSYTPVPPLVTMPIVVTPIAAQVIDEFMDFVYRYGALREQLQMLGLKNLESPDLTSSSTWEEVTDKTKQAADVVQSVTWAAVAIGALLLFREVVR